MQAGHGQKPRGTRRLRMIWSNRTVLGQLGLTLVIAVTLILPAGGLILAQSGFVPFSNSIISLDVSPADGSIVLAGTLNVPVPAGIYRSTDGGHTWSRANVVLPPDTSVATIRFDPQDGNRVLAADGGVGNLFISEDGGLNWRQESSIHQALTLNSGVGRLFTRIEFGQTVFYAGTRFDGVVRSADGGLSWAWYGSGLSGAALRVRAFVEKDGALYAGTHDGVWRLPAQTDAWQRVNLPAGVIARGMTNLDGRLYVGTFASGLYLSDDGYNWIQDPSFPAGVVIYDLAISGEQVIIATNVGLWTPSVPDWVRASVNGVVFTNPVYRLASAQSLEGVTYAGTEQDGVLRTIDGGVSFLSSAQITPLDPAELPGQPTDTPTATPTATDTPIATETPTATETPLPTVDANRDADGDVGSQCADVDANRDADGDGDVGSQRADVDANRDADGDGDVGSQCADVDANRDADGDGDVGSQCADVDANRDADGDGDVGSQCADVDADRDADGNGDVGSQRADVDADRDADGDGDVGSQRADVDANRDADGDRDARSQCPD